MKRAMILILTLCLCITTTTSAESLFDFLITPAPEVNDKAPSYGGMANVDASDVQDYGEKGQAVTYVGVDEDGYNGFIKYLAELGYEAVQSNVTDQSVEMIVNNGTFNIGLAYYAQEQKLMLVYDQGVAFEKRDVLKANFADAKRIELGQEFEIKGLGKFRFNEFVLGEDKECTAYIHSFNRSVGMTSWGGNTWLVFDYYNTSTEEQSFESGCNTLFKCSLWYINDDNAYDYDVNRIGYLYTYKDIQYVATDTTSSSNNHKIPALTSKEKCVLFALPKELLTSQDGYIVLEMSFDTENQEHYILVLREDGKKVGEW